MKRGVASLLLTLATACGGDDAAPVIDAHLDGDGSPIVIDAPVGVGPDADPNRPDGNTMLSCDGVTPEPGTPQLMRQLVVDGLDHPVWAGSPAGDSRLFIVERNVGATTDGAIRIFFNGSLLTTPFLIVPGVAYDGPEGEQGLLSMAFHPAYATNGKFYVSYTAASGNHVHVVEYTVMPGNPDLADAMSEREIIVINHPYNFHNGGNLAFGPDGYLYLGVGDTQGLAQDLSSLEGKMIRIDVNSSSGGLNYAIPADNPFLGTAGARPEIWSYGLRNPWRHTFDRETGDLYVGDVGQGDFEEIDFEPSGAGGRDYGWDKVEGIAGPCYNMTTCSTAGVTPPVYEYAHVGCMAAVGGVVYRGCHMPGHHGTYFFADFCEGWVRSFRMSGGAATAVTDWDSLFTAPSGVSHIGEDAQGELLIVQLRGQVYRVIAAP